MSVLDEREMAAKLEGLVNTKLASLNSEQKSEVCHFMATFLQTGAQTFAMSTLELVLTEIDNGVELDDELINSGENGMKIAEFLFAAKVLDEVSQNFHDVALLFDSVNATLAE